ncbi:hypothetical protein ACH5RR_025609 [Cinchona calisaya]|uniref:Transposase n=1 Tax=Cinchona calisaya TaxID=153742 RepID=A0ABD2Z046_9GENT
MDSDHVVEHIYKYGFMEDYWYWISHGKSKLVGFDAHGANLNNSEFPSNKHLNRNQSMVFDVVGPSTFGSRYCQEEQNRLNVDEPPNTEAAQFYGILQFSQQQLYPSCETLTKLCIAVQLMSLKLDYYLS